VRLAGDEFAVLLTGLTDGDEIERRVRQLGEPARLPVAVGGLDVELEATVGFALAPAHSTTADGLLRAAEVALHEAKRAGVAAAAYDPQVDDRDGAQLTTLTELRQAIEHDQLVLYYQPKLGREGTVGTVEALVRWQHPERGLLAPAAFLPLAEQTSLIGPLTAWVLRQAVRQCADWRATGRHLKVAVNVSARNLADPHLPELVASALAGAHLPAELLELEITETAVAADPARAVGSLKQIRRAGVTISLDDFGTGYTSLAQLSGFPVDGLKIDRTFIRSVDVDRSHQAIVRNVIKLSHDLGLSVVAEGVEDARTADLLDELECDFIQGYLLTPPLPPDAFLAWLDASAPSFAKPNVLPFATGV
jgi:EAL domain-containing protein (putative c-di-GMP-specific phosphodiesterase class I)